MYADPTLMDLAAAYAKRRNGRKTKHAVACDRPGAKAKMDASNELSRAIQVFRGEVDGLDNAYKAYLKKSNQNHKAQVVESTTYLRKYADRLVERANALEATRFSRPGAKAKMGRDEQIAKAERLLQEAKSLMDSNLWGKASARIMDLQDVLRGRANRGDKNITTDEKAQRLLTDAKAMLKQMETIRKSTHSALPPQTLEAERKPGGGSHSEAVSRKIATLINEGKPQDQAVAIALDLERRGEL